MAFTKKEPVQTIIEDTAAPVETPSATSDIDVYIARVDMRASLPEYKSEGASAMDVAACIPAGERIVIGPGERALIKTGLAVALPPNYEIQIRPRSGLALKRGITVINTPGTIDDDYRDEIGVVLINHGKMAFAVEHGDRIAQFVFAPVTKGKWKEVFDVSDIGRNRNGGFGSTGV